MNHLLNVVVLVQLVPFSIPHQIDPSQLDVIPEKCQPIPRLLYRNCCIFPPFFTSEIARECGAKFMRMFVQKNTNVTGLRRITDIDCSHWECILKKYFFLNSDGLVDDNKFFLHLDRWVDYNPPFSKPMLDAKLHCKQFFRTSFPLNPCEFNYFVKCIRNHISIECPVVINNDLCLEQAEFYKECKKYFI